MGLNISIHVTKQREGYGEMGKNPKGTREEIQDDLSLFLSKKFPLGGFGAVFVSEGSNISNGKANYDFSVDMAHYGADFEKNGYEMLHMWLALVEYCFIHFSHHEGIKLETSWNG